MELRDFLLPLLMNGQVRVKEKQEVRKQKSVFKRLVLSAYILDKTCDEATTGRVKFEKILHLSEYCAKIDFHSDYHRYAAGPYDPKALNSIEKQLSNNKWFKKLTTRTQYRTYERLEKVNNYKKYFDTIFSSFEKNAVDSVIKYLKSFNTERCEIISTLYGAWNDFLIENIQPTNEQIVNDVLNNWHEDKKRIERERWLKALGWMQEKGVVPVGFGMSTKV
jgi:type I restriction enzyme S subunit